MTSTSLQWLVFGSFFLEEGSRVLTKYEPETGRGLGVFYALFLLESILYSSIIKKGVDGH